MLKRVSVLILVLCLCLGFSACAKTEAEVLGGKKAIVLSDEIYYIENGTTARGEERAYIAHCDLNGENCRVLLETEGSIGEWLAAYDDRICFSIECRGIFSADAQGKTEELYSSSSSAEYLQVSRDTLYFAERSAEKSLIFALPLNGGELRCFGEFAKAECLNVCGDRIYFLGGTGNNKSRIMSIDINSGKTETVIEGDLLSELFVEGEYIYYSCGDFLPEGAPQGIGLQQGGLMGAESYAKMVVRAKLDGSEPQVLFYNAPLCDVAGNVLCIGESEDEVLQTNPELIGIFSELGLVPVFASDENWGIRIAEGIVLTSLGGNAAIYDENEKTLARLADFEMLGGDLLAKFTAADIIDKYGNPSDEYIKIGDDGVVLTVPEGAVFVAVSSVSVDKVVLSDSVELLGEFAFEGQETLSCVEFGSGLKKLSRGAFRSCTSLSELTLPQGLKEIGAECFAGCSSLAEIHIPESVELIDASAFDGCPPELVIIGKAGSYAEEYAKTNGIEFSAE